MVAYSRYRPNCNLDSVNRYVCKHPYCLELTSPLIPALLCLRVTALYAGYTRTIKIVWALFFSSYTIGGIFALISTATFFSESVPPLPCEMGEDKTAIDSDN
jgi:hypothetical protein